MTQTTHPSPQQVRDWIAQRQRERKPPPDPEEIRRQLGWDLIPKAAAEHRTASRD